jgi:two-component system cell cycle response regulator CpdR
MGQASSFKPIALVVEDDVLQRELVVVLLEESEMDVIQCEDAEEAIRILEKVGRRVSMMFTDANLAGKLDGVELAHFATRFYPNIHVIVTSGLVLTKELPEGAMFMAKPWLALDVLREAERSQHSQSH